MNFKLLPNDIHVVLYKVSLNFMQNLCIIIITNVFIAKLFFDALFIYKKVLNVKQTLVLSSLDTKNCMLLRTISKVCIFCQQL